MKRVVANANNYPDREDNLSKAESLLREAAGYMVEVRANEGYEAADDKLFEEVEGHISKARRTIDKIAGRKL